MNMLRTWGLVVMAKQEQMENEALYKKGQGGWELLVLGKKRRKEGIQSKET